MNITYQTAKTKEAFEDGKALFQAYAKSLNLDLSFQDFEKELDAIDKQYNKPKGALILAYKEKTAVGCAAIRELDSETAELKRMYVHPDNRGLQIGRKLLELSIETAKKLNYKKIRLDTLPTMLYAQRLYRMSGFFEIPSYRFNPVSGAVYMEKKLT